MFYIINLSDSLILLNAETKTTRILDGNEADCLKRIFPDLFLEDTVLSTVSVNSISPQKLAKYMALAKNATNKKVTEISK